MTIFYNLNAIFVFEVDRFFIVHYSLLALSILIPVLLSIAFFTLAERKIIASIQRRRGPNVVGMWGLGQPFADGLKALLKEIILPTQAKPTLFLLAPCITLFLSFINWAIVPFSYEEVIADLNYGLLYLYIFSSLSVYGIILAGWASQSKYPFLGAVRSAAQIVSYEVSIGLIFLCIALCTHSLNLIDVIYAQEISCWYVLTIPPLAGIFLISIIAETNRAPFDLPEAEAEIVAGYNLEYSAIIFAFFFLGEYGNIFSMATLYSLLFFGGWLLNSNSVGHDLIGISFLEVKVLFVCFLFVLIRATLPRYRYDQLIDLC